MIDGEWATVRPRLSPAETSEIVYLSVIGTLATALNSVVFVRLLRQSRTPTAQTSFMAGPYHISSFTLFKLSLCATDFLILLLHTFGKIIWLWTFTWPLGDSAASCKAYKALSIFAFYANSNVVAAIGLDRLKVVYTSHIQGVSFRKSFSVSISGATSVRRVRLMLACAWLLAATCSVPQLFVFGVFEVERGWFQCTDVFAILDHRNQSTMSTRRLALIYELYHQGPPNLWSLNSRPYHFPAAVFWLPFTVLVAAYLMIVLKLVHFTLRPVAYRAAAGVSSHVMSRSNSSSNRPAAYQQLLNDASIALDVLSGTPGASARPSSRLSTSGCVMAREKPSISPSCRSAPGATCAASTSATNPLPLAAPAQRKKSAFARFSEAPLICSIASSSSSRRLQKAPPLWRRQLRSRVFLTALLVVLAHVAMWLPYNVVSTLRVVDPAAFNTISDNWTNLLEDLIVVNSLLNPILYSYLCS